MITFYCFLHHQKGTSINGSNIYVGNTTNLSNGNLYFASQDSWFHLTKVTSNLTIKWQYWYGGDAYYLLHSIVATKDGGCLMVGSRYNYTNQDYIRDIYVVKVSPNGSTNWAKDITINDKINIYPNPGTNFINISSDTEYSIFFFIRYVWQNSNLRKIKSQNNKHKQFTKWHLYL